MSITSAVGGRYLAPLDPTGGGAAQHWAVRHAVFWQWLVVGAAITTALAWWVGRE
jgi:hypothetical protein